MYGGNNQYWPWCSSDMCGGFGGGFYANRKADKNIHLKSITVVRIHARIRIRVSICESAFPLFFFFFCFTRVSWQSHLYCWCDKTSVSSRRRAISLGRKQITRSLNVSIYNFFLLHLHTHTKTHTSNKSIASISGVSTMV